MRAGDQKRLSYFGLAGCFSVPSASDVCLPSLSPFGRKCAHKRAVGRRCAHKRVLGKKCAHKCVQERAGDQKRLPQIGFAGPLFVPSASDVC